MAFHANLGTWHSSKSKGIKSRITWTPTYHAWRWYRSSNLYRLLIASAAICGTMQLPSVANWDFSTGDWVGASHDFKGIWLALFHSPSPHGSNSKGMFGSIKPWQESPLKKGSEVTWLIQVPQGTVLAGWRLDDGQPDKKGPPVMINGRSGHKHKTATRYPAAKPQFATVAVVQKIFILRFLAASKKAVQRLDLVTVKW